MEELISVLHGWVGILATQSIYCDLHTWKCDNEAFQLNYFFFPSSISKQNATNDWPFFFFFKWSAAFYLHWHSFFWRTQTILRAELSMVVKTNHWGGSCVQRCPCHWRAFVSEPLQNDVGTMKAAMNQVDPTLIYQVLLHTIVIRLKLFLPNRPDFVIDVLLPRSRLIRHKATRVYQGSDIRHRDVKC